jgi:hypothetical protein
MPTVELDTFTRAYVECALWSSMDESDDSGGEPLDANYDVSDIAPETLAEMIRECQDFQASFGDHVDRGRTREMTDGTGERSYAGHHFWLTRNGHGAGFWDGGWEAEYLPLKESDPESGYATVGDYLTAMSKPYGEFNLYIGDDGLIHGQ